MAATAYIDGFSLYHLCFRGERNQGNGKYKWLDVAKLASLLLPDEDITTVRYYTARVGDVPEDPRRASRQDAYIRALRTVPNVSVHQGKFHRNKREVRLARPPSGISPVQTAFVVQEKGSDVALATHLLTDAFDRQNGVALIVTNDSDFVEPITVARSRFGLRVVVISPDIVVAKSLARVASFARPLDQELLAKAQLPNPLIDLDGREIHRPPEWR